MNSLHYIMYVDNLDMIFITETWLHYGISDGLLDPNSSFTIICRDREGCTLWGIKNTKIFLS